LELALRSFCKAGARLAGPGEFTLRAFLAGRIDLGQAEAVLGVIDAVDRRDLEIALGQLAGGLAHPLRRLRDALLELLAEIEAGFDFPDERLPLLAPEQSAERLGDARRQIDRLVAQMADRGAAGRGPRVILVGRPNAGKSSLLNALAGGSAALVSEHAGTTRDYLTADLDLGGIKCQLIDTAGEREEAGRPHPHPLAKGEGTDSLPSPACGRGAGGEGGSSPACDSIPPCPAVEQAAQAAAADQRRMADLEMVCWDATRPPEAGQREQLRNRDGRRILVVTKWDEKEKAAFWRKESLESEACFVSSRTGEGLAELKSELRRRLAASRSGRGEVMGATAARCHESLRIAGECVDRALGVALMGREELAAADLRLALEELGRVTGAVYTDDVLDQIFSRFCIGK
jgi:tRNA modification GTPase